MLPLTKSLKYFPSFLQQLEMESNGKTVTADGKAARLRDVLRSSGANLATMASTRFSSCCIWGGRLIPLRLHCVGPFRLSLARSPGGAAVQPLRAERGVGVWPRRGRGAREHGEGGRQSQQIADLLPHRVFAGNQPSSTLMLGSLTPETMGRWWRFMNTRSSCKARFGDQLVRPVGGRTGQGRREPHPAGDSR